MHSCLVFVNVLSLDSIPHSCPHTNTYSLDRLCEYESIESNFPETVVFSQFTLLSPSFRSIWTFTVCPVKNVCMRICVYGL